MKEIEGEGEGEVESGRFPFQGSQGRSERE